MKHDIYDAIVVNREQCITHKLEMCVCVCVCVSLFCCMMELPGSAVQKPDIHLLQRYLKPLSQGLFRPLKSVPFIS